MCARCPPAVAQGVGSTCGLGPLGAYGPAVQAGSSAHTRTRMHMDPLLWLSPFPGDPGYLKQSHSFVGGVWVGREGKYSLRWGSSAGKGRAESGVGWLFPTSSPYKQADCLGSPQESRYPFKPLPLCLLHKQDGLSLPPTPCWVPRVLAGTWVLVLMLCTSLSLPGPQFTYP